MAYSNRPASSRSASVQKRKTLYIAESDPRNNPKYKMDYYGEIVVLSDLEYANLLKRYTYLNPQDASITLPEPSKEVSTLHPPTNLYWDYADNNATEYVPSTTSTSINVYVTFDPGSDDVQSDGPITYEYVVTPVTSQGASSVGGSGSGSAAGGKGLGGTASTNQAKLQTVAVTVAHKTANLIELTWGQLAGATSYLVKIKGANQANSNGKATMDYNEAATSDATRYFSIYPMSGKIFSGAYTYSVSVVYPNGTSKAVTGNFTI